MLQTVLITIALSITPDIELIDARMVAQQAAVIKASPQPVNVKRIVGPSEAVEFALIDKLNPENESIAAFTRYIWIPKADPDLAAEVNVAVNECFSRNEALIAPKVLFGGHLLRYDLRDIAGDDDFNFLDVLFNWTDMAFDDPFFHLQVQEKFTEMPTLPWFDVDGKEWKSRQCRIAIPHPHTGAAGLELAAANGLIEGDSLAGGIYRAEWFVEIIKSTTNGGRYYQLRGIKQNVEKGKNPLDEYFRGLGLSTAEMLLLKPVDRALLRRSEPTGKPRVVIVTRRKDIKPSRGQGLVTATLDMSQEQFRKIGSDPWRNLIIFDFAAWEIITENANGTHEYLIADKQGQIVDVGDQNIAADHLEPSDAGVKILEPSRSCQRCHNREDGYRKFENSVLKKLSDHGIESLGITNDLLSNKSIDRTLRELAAVYQSDPNMSPLGPLELGRQSYAMIFSKIALMRKPVEMGEIYSAMHKRFAVDLVTAKTICDDLGWQFEDEVDAVSFLTALVGRIEVLPDGSGKEDTIVHDIKVGIPVQPFQYTAVFGDIAARLNANMNKLLVTQKEMEPAK